jgi:hypothetical protein
MRTTHLSTARVALFAGLAFAITACADTATGPAGGDPLLAVGEDLTLPVLATFGSGMESSGVPLRDDRFEVSDDGGATWKKAFVIDKHPRWVHPITGTEWIGPREDASNFFSIPLETDRYRTTFNLPANAADPVLNVRLWSDNAATVYVNGTQIGQQPQTDEYSNYGCLDPTPDFDCGGGNFAHPDDDAFRYYTGPADPVVWNIGGVNTLEVVVLNAEFKQSCQGVPDSPDCQSATGLDIRATVHYNVVPTGVCDGGVNKIVVKYVGAVPLAGEVRGQRRNPTQSAILPGQISGVAPDLRYTFATTDLGGLFSPVANGRIANNFRIYIGEALISDFHTSCSAPIYPGMILGGLFEITEVYSVNGGLIGP